MLQPGISIVLAGCAYVKQAIANGQALDFKLKEEELQNINNEFLKL
ncbi:hypothetical protein [Sphingobacterium shayense]|nr:hypothetical protein [Sphingobacterium shayense]